MDTFEGSDTQPVPQQARQQLLEPFLHAAQVALAEMAGTETAVRATYRSERFRPLGDLSAVLRVASPTVVAIVLHFPARTAAALAGRVLAGVVPEPDESMVRDCLGEIVNVLAGQAKPVLLGTPHHFTLSTPLVVASSDAEALSFAEAESLVAVIAGEGGDFALQLCLKHCPG